MTYTQLHSLKTVLNLDTLLHCSASQPEGKTEYFCILFAVWHFGHKKLVNQYVKRHHPDLIVAEFAGAISLSGLVCH